MMTTIEPIKYKYGLNLKLNHAGVKTAVNQVFPSVEDLMVSSTKFDDLESCLRSLSQLNQELILSLNTALDLERYGMLTEMNPKYGEQATISKEWGQNEIAKVWIVDKIRRTEDPSAPIKAISLSQVLEVHGEPEMLN